MGAPKRFLKIAVMHVGQIFWIAAIGPESPAQKSFVFARDQVNVAVRDAIASQPFIEEIRDGRSAAPARCLITGDEKLATHSELALQGWTMSGDSAERG